MRKIKKVLGLVLAVTICVLGLASCGDNTTVATFEAYVKEGTSGYEIKQVSGELYVATAGFEKTSSYLLLGSDGKAYTIKNEEGKSYFIFYREWKQIDKDIIKIGDRAFLKTEKYLVKTDSYGYFITAYMKVDGIENANE